MRCGSLRTTPCQGAAEQFDRCRQRPRRLLEGGCPPVVLLLLTDDEDLGDHFVAESGAAAYLTKSAFGPERLQEAWSTAVH